MDKPPWLCREVQSVDVNGSVCYCRSRYDYCDLDDVVLVVAATIGPENVSMDVLLLDMAQH